MPKLDLALQPTPDGAMLVVLPEGQPPLAVPLPLERAIAIFQDLWRCLGHHYGKGEMSNDATTPPRMLEIGDFSQNVGGKSTGVVQLWLRPEGFAGIAYELQPAQARALASQLNSAADLMDAFKKPHN